MNVRKCLRLVFCLSFIQSFAVINLNANVKKIDSIDAFNAAYMENKTGIDEILSLDFSHRNIINSSFVLDHLYFRLSNSLWIYSIHTFSILFYHCDGFSIDLNKLISINLNFKSISSHLGFNLNLQIQMEFIRSKIILIDQMNRNKQTIGSCHEYLKHFENKTVPTLFTDVHYLLLRDSTTLDTKLCPLFFKDSRLKSMIIEYNVRSIIRTNLIEFDDDDKESNNSISFNNLNASIISIILRNNYRLKIDKYLLNRRLMKQVETIKFEYGTIAEIEETIFKAFSSLRILEIILYNFRELIHSSTNKWLMYINYGKNLSIGLNQKQQNESFDLKQYIRLNSVKFDFRQEAKTYDMIESYSAYKRNDDVYSMTGVLNQENYLEEDFCLYKHYPQQQMVRFSFFINMVERMNCTFLFLYKLRIDYLLNDSQLKLKSSECNFTQRLKLCDLNEFRAPFMNFYMDIYDVSYALKIAAFVGPVILFPVVSFLGFLFNLLIILIVQNKKNQKEIFKRDALYNYMLLIATFNMIECFLSIFNLMNICLGFNSIYCTAMNRSRELAYFKVYGIELICEILKTSSSLTGLTFSIERFVATVKVKWILAKKFQEMNIIGFSVFVLIFSSLISYCKVNEFAYRSDAHYELNNILVAFNFHYSKTYGEKWLTAYNIFHYVFNDIFLFMLNLIIDLAFIIHVRHDIYSKIKRLKSLEKNNTKREKKLKELEEKKSDTKKLVIYFLALNIFTRLPELAFHFVARFKSIIYIEKEDNFFNDMYDFTQFLYQLSYSLNIFFFYSFNKQFKQGTNKFLGISTKNEKKKS